MCGTLLYALGRMAYWVYDGYVFAMAIKEMGVLGLSQSEFLHRKKGLPTFRSDWLIFFQEEDKGDGFMCIECHL